MYVDTSYKYKVTYILFQPYRKCAKYQKEVLNNPITYSEIKRYHESSEYLAVSTYLMLKKIVNISLYKIYYLFVTKLLMSF